MFIVEIMIDGSKYYVGKDAGDWIVTPRRRDAFEFDSRTKAERHALSENGSVVVL